MGADALHIKNDIIRIVTDTNDTAVLEQIREFLGDLEDVRLYGVRLWWMMNLPFLTSSSNYPYERNFYTYTDSTLS